MGPDDLERLATAAYLAVGTTTASRPGSARTRSAARGRLLRAARCAFWLVFRLLITGEFARAGGWLARARRLLDDAPDECAEQGYLLMPDAFQHAVTGDWATAYTIAGRAAEIGDRFGDLDLVTLARNLQGRALIAQGRIGEGMACSTR